MGMASIGLVETVMQSNSFSSLALAGRKAVVSIRPAARHGRFNTGEHSNYTLNMKYKIEVHAIGYEDTAMIVEAPSLRVAKQSELKAKVEWCDHNAIDYDGNFEMPFTRITNLSKAS